MNKNPPSSLTLNTPAEFVAWFRSVAPYINAFRGKTFVIGFSGEMVTITIADNGMGMDETVQSRMFEPFFTTKDVGEGTGLGLSIVQGIIEKHNGHIVLESAVGQGSTFTLTLPVHQTVEFAKSA